MLENPGYTIRWYDIIDSTSSMALREMDSLSDRTVIAAEFQTAGKGQGDHVWLSGKGENLTFTIIRKFDEDSFLAIADQQLITMASSLSVKDFLKHLGIEAKVKKPNDIYVSHKKICGMLIENGSSNGLLEWSSIGIGVNLNQKVFDESIPNAVSATLLTGINYDIKACLYFFLEDFERRFDSIWTDRENLIKEYQDSLLAL